MKDEAKAERIAETLFQRAWVEGMVMVNNKGITREELFEALEKLRDRILLAIQSERASS